MKRYDTASYAATRLNDTIIRKGSMPVLVQACEDWEDDDIMIYWGSIISGDSGHDVIGDMNLDPAPLGYVNYDGRVTYMTRMPMRNDWKQGVRDRNLVSADGFNNELSYKTIGKTIAGDFPTFTKTVTLLSSSNYQEVAFDRNFSINRGGLLCYKGRFDVGKVNLENGSVNIDDAFSWAREAFEETMEQAA